jgi:hypothetical protein
MRDKLFHELNLSAFQDLFIITILCSMIVGTAYTTIACTKKRASVGRVGDAESDENILTI